MNCKDIKDTNECKKRNDCLVNKNNKCQKKPTKKMQNNKQKSDSVSSSKTKKLIPIKSTELETPEVNLKSKSSSSSDSESSSSESESSSSSSSSDSETLKTKSSKKSVKDPCKERDNIITKIKELSQEKTQLMQECNETKYMSESEQKKLVKLMDLIKYIHKEEIYNCQDLFDKFPDSDERTKGFSKPYIFEALWKIIFLLRLDNLTDGYDRKYKIRLDNDDSIKEYEYLYGDNKIANINSGSISGIADFYFTVLPKKKSEDAEEKEKEKEKEKGISDACKADINTPEIHDAYIFTSKFYKKEKGLTNYDIAEIAVEALKKYGFDKQKFKIVSLVKNGSEYRNRIQTSSKDIIKSYIDSNLILDEGDLRLVYYPKLYKWIEHHFINYNKDIDSEHVWGEILKNSEPITNILDKLRFHQKYVVEYTNQIVEANSEVADDNPGRFIWGAVARSGKSFMVGGLVALRRPKFVLLILGAVNETKSQFIDELFKEYTDLKEYYKVIDFQNAKDRNKIINENEKYVVVISQESLRLKVFQDYCKNNLDDDRCKKIKKKLMAEEAESLKNGQVVKGYNNEIIEKIKEFLVEPNKIIFFDEIHQGSGTDSMQEETIRFFYNPEFPKPLMIMVTATYAKPLAKYGTSIDGKESVLIEWNYEMIMKMKNFQFSNVVVDASLQDTPDSLIDSNSENFEEKMNLLKQITEELNANGKTCEDIAHEYDKNPELVYLLPTLKENYDGKSDSGIGIDKDYNIVVDDGPAGEGEKINIKRNLKEIFRLKKGEKTFKYGNAVNKLLDYINEDVYDKLLEKEYDFVANGEGDFHSQLWFLPTSMKNADGKKPDASKKDDDDRAIVAPMLKNLGKAIINHPKFINFNVCVVHSGNEKERDFIESDDKEDKRKLYFKCIKGNVKTCIKKIEIESKNMQKSLIILTAQRLRLGVSLPCVDVAIHMDNIKSYDIIYQSMFRVLTERPGKARGFFVDMVIDRAIQFFYKYTKIQKNLKPKEITREHIKKSLLLFDAGSIKKSLGFTSIVEPINSYKDIATEFKIDKDEKDGDDGDDSFEKFRDDIDYDDEDNSLVSDNDTIEEEEETIDIDTDKTEVRKKRVVKLLEDLYKDETIKDDLMEIIDNVFENVKKTSNKDNKKGKKVKPFKGEVELANAAIKDMAKDDEQNNQPLIEDIHTKFKNIVEQIKNIFTLIILFNGEEVELQDAMDIRNLDIDRIKDCDDPDIMYYCYLIATRPQNTKVGDIVTSVENSDMRGQIVSIQNMNQNGDELGKEDEKEEEEIINVNDDNDDNDDDVSSSEEEIDVKGGAKRKEKVFKISWENGETKEYTEKEMNNKIRNISVTNKFNFQNVDREYIRESIKKNIALIRFLLENEKEGEINNLFVNIKDKMRDLNGKIENEKQSFINSSEYEDCPPDFIENEKVLDIIRKYLTPKDAERKLFGEVFTPLNLICEMLGKLPRDVWSDKHKKWLDPANGIGNFPIVVYYKLMEGLKQKITNEKERSVWIIEHMIYMNELNPINIAITKKIFKMLDSTAKPNIIKGDTLKMDFKKAFKLPNDFEGFDIILGNPPYNPPKTETGSSGNSIWQNFVMKSFEFLKDKGYLCLVHPPGWKKPTDKVFSIDKFTSGDYTKQIRQGQVWQFLKEKGVFTFIYTNDQKNKKQSDYLQHFPSVDFYVYQKGGDKHKLCNTKNVFLGEVILSNNVKLNYNLDYLPNLITSQTQEILHKITAKQGDKADFKRFRASNGFSQDSSKGKYKYFYIVNSKKERQYQYSDTRDENIDINKVVMNWQGGIDTYYVSYIKSNEKLGAFDKVMYSKVNTDKQGRHLESFFKSDIVKFIFLITQYASGMRTVNEHLVANSITIPPEEESEYYKFFDIEKHKEYIEDILSKHEHFTQPKKGKNQPNENPNIDGDVWVEKEYTPNKQKTIRKKTVSKKVSTKKKSENSKTNSKTKTNRGKQNKKVLKTKKASFSFW